MRKLSILLLAASLMTTACSVKKAETPKTDDTKKEASTGAPKAEDAAAKETPSEDDAKEAKDTAQAKDAEDAAPLDELAGQEEGNGGPLERIDFKGRRPDGFEGKGEVAAVIGFRDKHGINAVVFERTGPNETSQLMTIRHALQEGDGSWTDVRAFKELVSDCEFDITLRPELGDWSVTDLDGDGLGEVTFAYSAGCRSDVSPVAHKVLMTEDGEKYALRGQTKIEDMGGEFKAGPEFAQAPEGFEAHAKSAWAKTVAEFDE